jgi:drug/metabolite transporter (DMT)-like permease
MLFASKGLFAKFLYAQGVDFETLVTARATLALPLFWAFTLAREGAASFAKGSRTAVYAAAAAGFLCYYVGALTDFYALTMIDASIERALLFSYPAIVVLISCALTRRLPSRRTAAAVGLAYVGIFLTIGGFDVRVVRANALGAVLVIISALTFAIYFVVGERYMRDIGSGRFTLYAMTAAAVALCVHFLARHDLAALAMITGRAWGLLIVMATACMFVPALLQAEGVRRIGAQRGAVVSTVGPPTTVLLAWLLLDERVSELQLLGVALIVAGVLLLDLLRSAR